MSCLGKVNCDLTSTAKCTFTKECNYWVHSTQNIVSELKELTIFNDDENVLLQETVQPRKCFLGAFKFYKMDTWILWNAFRNCY